MNITQRHLKCCYFYNPKSGNLYKKFNKFWKISGYIRKNQKGKKYIRVSVNGKTYPCHHIVWFYMTGKFPNEEIDHIDGNGMNNKWDNLREVCHAENCRNQRLSVRNTSGRVGVRWSDNAKKWVAKIKYDKKYIHLGYHNTFESASKAREDAELKYKFHTNHGQCRPL